MKTSIPCFLFLIYWQTHNIATLNDNGMSVIMRLPMPTVFHHKQEAEVLLLQEDTPIEIDLLRGYNAYTNVVMPCSPGR